MEKVKCPYGIKEECGAVYWEEDIESGSRRPVFGARCCDDCFKRWVVERLKEIPVPYIEGKR